MQILFKDVGLASLFSFRIIPKRQLLKSSLYICLKSPKFISMYVKSAQASRTRDLRNSASPWKWSNLAFSRPFRVGFRWGWPSTGCFTRPKSGTRPKTKNEVPRGLRRLKMVLPLPFSKNDPFLVKKHWNTKKNTDFWRRHIFAGNTLLCI